MSLKLKRNEMKYPNHCAASTVQMATHRYVIWFKSKLERLAMTSDSYELDWGSLEFLLNIYKYIFI